MKNVEKAKKIEIIKMEIIPLIPLIIIKIQQSLNDLMHINEKITKENKEIFIKLIYFSDKYSLVNENNLIKNITNKLQEQSLNIIYREILLNYKISDTTFESIISSLIYYKKLAKIYDILFQKKWFSKFENFLKMHIITENEIFETKENLNILLLYLMKDNKYFELYSNSFYALEINKILGNINNKILSYNISYNEVSSILNNEKKLEILNISKKNITFDEQFKKIKKLNNIIKNIEELLIDIKKMNFLYREIITKYLEALQDELRAQPIGSLVDLESKKNKIITIDDLFKDFKIKIKSNNLFNRVIKQGEKNNNEEYEKAYNLFEQLLFIFEKEKCNEITSDALIFMRSNIPINLDDKKKNQNVT